MCAHMDEIQIAIGDFGESLDCRRRNGTTSWNMTYTREVAEMGVSRGGAPVYLPREVVEVDFDDDDRASIDYSKC